MIEKWKLGREIEVISSQLATPVTFFTNRLRKRNYEKKKSRTIRISEGAMLPGSEIAVFLIYQPNGVPGSIVHTCGHLAGKGISPFIVSNSRLSNEDRRRLADVSWKIMERPNFGYDFGGYREGILYLDEHDLIPDRLYLLNDSIWFPLFSDSDLIDRLRELNVDVASPVQARYKHRPDHTFIHSYLMRFDRRAIVSDGFLRYWRELPMSNNKMAVVRGGEKRLAMRMEELGLSAGAVWNIEDALREIEHLSDNEFLGAADYTADIYQAAQRRLDAARSAELDIAANRDSLIQSGYFGRDLLKTFPLVTIGRLGIPFMKKLRQDPFRKARRSLLESELSSDLAPAVRKELASWDG